MISYIKNMPVVQVDNVSHPADSGGVIRPAAQSNDWASS